MTAGNQDRHTAAQIFTNAWHQADKAGIAPELAASTALTLCLSQLVKTSGKDATIRITKRLVGALEDGRFDE